MPHRHPHKTAHRVKPKYKKLALIAAAAAVLSTTALPGMPASTAHAASSDMSATTSQQIGKTTTSSSQINAERAQSPASPATAKPEKKPSQVKEFATKSPIQSPKAVKKNNQKNTTKQVTEKTSKVPNKEVKPEKTKTAPPEGNQDTTKKQSSPEKPKGDKSPSSSNNAPDHYKEVLDISATAYAPGPHDNEQWGTKTHIGTEVRPGIIAVDPKLIPLGSRVYIEYPDGHGEYATAEDTGGAIKGNRIDVAKQTVSEAQDFGIQKVKVYVVHTPKNA